MRSVKTIPEMRKRHRAEERRLVLAALERNAWSLSAAARDLGVQRSTLQRVVESTGLAELHAKHAQPRGRPKSRPSPGALTRPT